MVKGRTGQRVRLYVRGTILGYKRSKSNQYETTSLVQIEGVNTKEDVAWSPVRTETRASSVPSSCPTSRLSPWGARSECSCTRAASKVLLE
uniref:Uncharacterized protein n=1 Tax=Zea mays TaxID=4577 RepID=A0A804Q9N7_MAIZE